MFFRRGGWMVILLPWLLINAACSSMFSRLDPTGYYVNKSYGFTIKAPLARECWEEKLESNYLFVIYHWEGCKKTIFTYDGKYFGRAHSRWEAGMRSNLKEWIEYNYGAPAIETVNKKGIQGWVVRKQGHPEITYSTDPWEAWYFICYSKDKDVLVIGYDGNKEAEVKEFEALVDTLEFTP